MIELRNVSKFYNTDGNMAVGIQNISLTYDLGEFVAITGESGSGKSTLLSVLSGLDSYEEGEMLIQGKSTSDFTREDFDHYRNQMVGFVFQNYNLIDSYSTLENVMLPLLAKGLPVKEARKDAIEIIRKVGLQARLRSKASKLSGGEKQRTVIARALASGAPIIACDEPTGNLDSNTGREILELLNNIRENRLVLIVTHDYESVKKYCTRHTILKDGHVADDRVIAPKQNVTEVPSDLEKTSRKPELFHIAVTNVLHTPRRTLLSLLMATVTSLAILAIIGGFIQTNATLTDLYTDEMVSIYANRASNRLVTYPSGNETDSVTGIIGDAETFIDEGNVLSDIAFTIENQYFSPSRDETNAWDRLLGTLYQVYPNFVVTESMDLLGGRAPTGANEFALILDSSLNFAKPLSEIPYVFEDDRWTIRSFDYSTYDTAIERPDLACVGLYTMQNMDTDVKLLPSAAFASSIRNDYLIYCGRPSIVNGYQMNMMRDIVDIHVDGENYVYRDYFTMAVYENNDPTSGVILSKNNVVLADTFYEGKLLQLKVYNQIIDIPTEDIVYHEFDLTTTYGDVPILFTANYVRSLAATTGATVSIFTERASDMNTIQNGLLAAGYETYRSDATVRSLNFVYILGNFMLIFLTMLSFVGYVILGFVTFIVTRVVFMLIYQNKKKDYAIFETLGMSKKHVRFINRAETGIVFIASYVLATGILWAITDSPYSFALIWSKPYLLLLSLAIIFVLALLIARRYEKKLFALTVNKVLKAGDFLD